MKNKLLSFITALILFLFIVLCGGILGIFISSYFLSVVINFFYFEMIYIFLGIIIYYFLVFVNFSAEAVEDFFDAAYAIDFV